MGDITGTAKADRLSGSSGDDTIRGLAGNDRIHGKGGLDTIYGGAGNDIMDGGVGDDSLYGEKGNDRLYGGAGSDYLAGGEGNDILAPGAGKNVASGGAGNDTFYFNQDESLQSSEFYGEEGRNTFVFTEDSPAEVIGMPWGFHYANNLVFVSGIQVFDASAASSLAYSGGRFLNTKVIGTKNDDTFYGNSGNEVLVGGRGDDIFDPRSGTDTVTSSRHDSDLVQYDTSADTGADIMTGFNGAGRSGGDMIEFNQVLSPGSDPHPVTVSVQDGHTLFDWEIGSLLVDTVGLVKDVDYFVYLA
ncbi:calcium-binding protein [Skermanella aerolata]|nr:calcium-binding protein [Skermanella aerolata]